MTIDEYREACARSLNLAYDKRSGAVQSIIDTVGPPLSEHQAWVRSELIRRASDETEREIRAWGCRLTQALAMTEDQNGNWIYDPIGPFHSTLARQLCDAVRKADQARAQNDVITAATMTHHTI